jgi:hypothetical protein
MWIFFGEHDALGAGVHQTSDAEYAGRRRAVDCVNVVGPGALYEGILLSMKRLALVQAGS